uniref:Uncharacterized protein n=1 Tax=Cucumis melo TaxID=3656 RepID=A0A9I9E5I7_CUCME
MYAKDDFDDKILLLQPPRHLMPNFVIMVGLVGHGETSKMVLRLTNLISPHVLHHIQTILKSKWPKSSIWVDGTKSFTHCGEKKIEVDQHASLQVAADSLGFGLDWSSPALLPNSLALG